MERISDERLADMEVAFRQLGAGHDREYAAMVGPLLKALKAERAEAAALAKENDDLRKYSPSTAILERAQAAEALLDELENNVRSWDTHSTTDVERSVVNSFSTILRERSK